MTLDPRWDQLLNHENDCGCGKRHRALLDLAFRRPEQYPGSEVVPNAEAVDALQALSEDFCVIDGKYYFVRGVLLLPLIGVPEKAFTFSVWASLSSKDFKSYVDTFDSGEQSQLGSLFAWFGNEIRGYPDTLNLKCAVLPRDGRMRPLIELGTSDHPLAVDQRQGVTVDRLLEIVGALGHPIRLPVS